MTNWYNESLGLKVGKFVEVTGRSAAQLLDDREVFEELKKSNPKMLEYLTSNAPLHKQLLAFVTQMPQPNDTPARQFKYPMAACQLFEEVPPLLRMSFATQDSTKYFFDALFGILQSSEALNSLLTSYFGRIYETVCRGQLYTPLINYLRANTQIMDVLIANCENSSLLKCLKWLIIVDDKDGYEVENWCQFKLQVLGRIMTALTASLSRDQFLAESLLELLAELVQKHMIMYHKHELLGALLEPERIALLLRVAVGRESCSTAAVHLLMELVMHGKSVEEMEAAAVLDGFFGQLTTSLGDLLSQIERPTLKCLEILELLAQTLRLKRKIVGQVHFPVFCRLLDMITQYEECNLLHCKLERVVCAVFQQPDNQDLIDYLFKDCDIVGRTVTGMKIEHRFRSHFGLIIRIAKQYTNPAIKLTPAVTEGIERNRELWTQFSKIVLEPYMSYITKDLGSYAIEDKDNSSATGLYTIKSFVKNMPEPNRFKVQQASCIDQAPTSLISLDFMADSNEIIPLKDNGNFELSFERPKQLTPVGSQSDSISMETPALALNPPLSDSVTNVPTVLPVPTTLPPPPPSAPSGYVPGGISATKSFEDFMKKRRAELENSQSSSKSRTPNKTTVVPTSTFDAGSARKKNRWQSVDPPAQQPKKASTKEHKQNKAVKLQLPVIHLFKIRKPEGHPTKTRKICVNRDQKLKMVLDALNNSVLAQ